MKIEPIQICPEVSVNQPRPAGVTEPADTSFQEFLEALPNPHTRRVYSRSVKTCSSHFEARGSTLSDLSREEFAEYINTHPGSLSTKKLILAAIRSYFTVTQVLRDPTQGIRVSSEKRRTASLASDEAIRRLLDSLDTTSVIGLRDKIIILLLLIYGLTVEALTNLNIEDARGETLARLQLHPRNLALSTELAATLEAYLLTTNLVGNPGAALLQTLAGKTSKLTSNRLSRIDISKIIKKRTEAIDLKFVTVRTLRAMVVNEPISAPDR